MTNQDDEKLLEDSVYKNPCTALKHKQLIDFGFEQGYQKALEVMENIYSGNMLNDLDKMKEQRIRQ